MNDTLQLLIGILREKFHPEGEPRAEASFQELGLDSLDTMNFLFSVEEQTGVSVPDEEIAAHDLRTLGALAGYVAERRGK